MSRSLDPTDFPLLPLPPLKLAVQLLPVTKIQFEYMLGDGQGFDQAAYAEMTRGNLRTSWRCPEDRAPGLFVTGILPAEAEAYARWLGDGFRLPTDAEWRAADAALAAPANRANLGAAAASRSVHPAARGILERALAAGGAPSWREISMFAGGLLEWVRAGTGFGLRGRPRPELYRLIHNPQIHEPIRPRELSRHPAFGFRLVKPLPAGSTP